jgi:hypothetical protein
MSMPGNQSDEFYKQKKASSSTSRKTGWFEKLRDQLQRGEDIRWFVVVCGDEERQVPEEMKHQVRPREGGILGADYGAERSQSQSRSRSQSYSQGQGQRSRSRSHSQGQGQGQGQSQSKSQRATPTMRQDEWPSYQSGGLSLDPGKGKGGLRRLFGKRHEDSP